MKLPFKPIVIIALLAPIVAVVTMYAALVYALSGDWDLSPPNKLYALIAGSLLGVVVAVSVCALHAFFQVRSILICIVAAIEVSAVSFTFYIFNALSASC